MKTSTSFNICTLMPMIVIQSMLSQHHSTTKVETSLVESFNSLIRYYLARFNRRTKRYSKAFDIIYNSLLLLKVKL